MAAPVLALTGVRGHFSCRTCLLASLRVPLTSLSCSNEHVFTGLSGPLMGVGDPEGELSVAGVSFVIGVGDEGAVGAGR